MPEAEQAVPERTLVILKPDALRRGLVGAILRDLELRGARVVVAYANVMPGWLVDEHYAHVKDRDFYPAMRDFMTSGPSMRIVLEQPGRAAPDQAGRTFAEMVRFVIGPTDHRSAPTSTIRGRWSIDHAPVHQNVIHASETPKEALVEIERFFPGGIAPDGTHPIV
jgi:nucleoside-diphosphate kinase